MSSIKNPIKRRHQFLRALAVFGILATVATISATSTARGCPFCSAAMQTLSQEIESADVALIAELVEPMPTSASDDAGEQIPAARFRIVDVIRGQDRLEGRQEIEVIYFGDEAPDRKFMITGLAGVTGPGLDWTTPVPLSEAAIAYVKKLPTAPAQGADRLAFFQDYLQHDDPLLAQDAYDEFARTPYADVQALGPRMNREQVLKWIDDADVGPSSRRLYLTMLGVCGQPQDVGLLEELMNFDYQLMKPGIAAAIAASAAWGPPAGVSIIDEVLHMEERRKRESLDALVACYIKLKGPSALDLINELFLSNPKVEFKHLHATLMALRFHGEETDVLPREKLLESMRLALDHKEFADQVIPDLTRWEDWDVMPRLVAMFKESPPDDWVRQPVASYLLVAAEAPGAVGERAQSSLAELEQLDKPTIDRARSLSAFGFLQRASAPKATTVSADATGADASTKPASAQPGAATSDATPNAPATNDAAPDTSIANAADASDAERVEPTDDGTKAAASADPPASGAPETKQVAAASQTPPSARAAGPVAGAGSLPVAAAPPTPPSPIKIVGIPLLAAAVLLAIFAVLLRGADPRSSDENP
jgi:hypothetical protein